MKTRKNYLAYLLPAFIGVLLMIVWINYDVKTTRSEWIKNNNTHPIKCKISSAVDSIGRYGRGVFVLLEDGSKFIFNATENDSNDLTPDIHNMINIGDSLISSQNSRIILVKNDKKEIKLKMNELDYEGVGCYTI